MLADAPWAPHDLVRSLSLDEIDVARPLIARSRALDDADLIKVLVAATLDHQIEVARRPNIGGPVVSAILDQALSPVMAALAGNETADVSPFAMERLVSAARRTVALRAPLARHPRLGAELARRLYSFVGDALRADLAARFKVDGVKLGDAVDGAVDGAVDQAGGDTDRHEMDSRLIEKLAAAGELRPGFLLRALREGRLNLFESALAALSNTSVDEVRQASGSAHPELLALLCAAVGIDRSVFPTALALVRALNEGRPDEQLDSARRIAAAYDVPGPEEAARRFRTALASV